ncbi:DNA-directed RNA polymeras-like protein I 49 kDa polypeptide [Zopfia rhizophila CBS 207.26]|uniref:DNA-directed RNA polymeras-like protein I 49 kDa polypeptide n=1 Tax=Zopfia rhizophila CBS 207.26 TaxID=1314779 RepID=A0A6A6DS26_9PEZI|nr:DNA-directed RNA polymeras-like protein I 49 kDa polypeptide [Zopfia rhizophila CBS 207.26]
MSEKKRKRYDYGGEPASKKAAMASLPLKVRLKFVEGADVLGPVIASTPGLSFPSNISLKTYKKGSNSILPPGTSSPYELLLHSSDHPRLDYTAQEEKEGNSDSLLKDYVGVFDPATNELQLVEVHKVTVRSTLRSEMDELREEREQFAARKNTLTARRHALAMDFGSKKSKKAIADQYENSIARNRDGDPGDEAVASAVLQNMGKTTAAMPTKEDLQVTMDESRPRPKANGKADSVPDVYPIETVIGNEILTAIQVKDWVDAAERGEPVEVHSRYVAKRMLKLSKSKDITKLKALKFIQHCIDFNAALKSRGKGAKMVPLKEQLEAKLRVSGPIVNAIKRKFTSETNDMTRWHIDRLMTHVAAAALIVDNFEVDVNDLRDDLKLENKEIKQYFLEIGCRVNPPTEPERTKLKVTKAETINHSIAKLKLPLTFPKPPRAPKKRK